MQFLPTVLTIGYLNNLCAGSPEEPPAPTAASWGKAAVETLLYSTLLEELYGHLLLHVCAFQGRTELLKADHLIPIPVCLKNRSLRNAVELIITVGQKTIILLLIKKYSSYVIGFHLYPTTYFVVIYPSIWIPFPDATSLLLSPTTTTNSSLPILIWYPPTPHIMFSLT